MGTRLDPSTIRACAIIQSMVNIATLVPVLDTKGKILAYDWINEYLDALVSRERLNNRPLSDEEITQLVNIGTSIMSMLKPNKEKMQ